MHYIATSPIPYTNPYSNRNPNPYPNLKFCHNTVPSQYSVVSLWYAGLRYIVNKEVYEPTILACRIIS